MNIYWIQEQFLGNSQLGMIPCPKGREKLVEEIQELKSYGIDTLVCLLQEGEINNLGLAKEEVYCKQEGMNFYSFPIPDYGVPPEKKSFLSLINWMDEEIYGQKKIVVHCKGGIGRSSLVIAGVLLKRGIPLPRVFPAISRVRGHQTPETKAQLDWISELRNSFLTGAQ